MSQQKIKTLRVKKYLTPSNVDEGSDIRIYANLDEYRAVDSWIQLRDCNKSICLGFYFSNEKKKKERLVKINTLINELTKLRDWIEKVEI